MPDLSFVTLDVFTTRRFEGNPLAIVHVPAGADLAQDTKQKIAREFDFSETVFLHDQAADDSSSSSSPGEHKIDIFTVDQELPFAGHPTIGAASHVLGSSASCAVPPAALLVKAGRIPIERVGTSDSLAVVRASVPHDVHIHRNCLRTTEGLDAVRSRAGSATVIGHGDPAIEAAELDGPVVSIVRGMAFVLVQLDSLEQLAQLSVARGAGFDFDLLPTLLDAGPWGHGGGGGGHVSRYYYVVTATHDNDGKPSMDLRTRLIVMREEDPATGSAACTLASYLALQKCGAADAATPAAAGQTLRYNITQGVEMGRRSEILVEVAMGADGRSIDKVFLGGSAVEVTRGTLSV
ncbi:MAG: hypothetical protein STHCBS139747_004998 [Sporothrix thermara]